MDEIFKNGCNDYKKVAFENQLSITTILQRKLYTHINHLI